MKLQISDIKISKRIRKDFGDISTLAENIKKDGLIQPIIVTSITKKKYLLLAGHRRLLAHIHLKEKTIEGRILNPQ